VLNQSTRTTILELFRKGVGKRTIARTLKVSRGVVREVIRSDTVTPPPFNRAEKAEPFRREILELFDSCEGNLVRVHEELAASGVKLSYPALTAFCRRAGIGGKPAVPAGQYHFEPGQELQHDTSPHEVVLGGRKRPVQTASAVLCYSRMLFFQCSPRFQRFDCKVFLTEALKYFGGGCATVMIDNTHVVVLKGTGADMVPVPEMEAFAERYGFVFRAHAVGAANRSGRVERPFHYIENNFFPGRTFSDWTDLNAQAREWCERVNGKYKRHLRAVPRELFAVEKPCLKPLPVWVPEVYRLYQRTVDVEGYVSLHTNRYSVPAAWLGRSVEVREAQDRVDLTYGRQSVSHARLIDAMGQRVTTKEHRPPRWTGPKKTDPSPEEKTVSQLAPDLLDYVAALKKRGRKQTTLALRQLLRMIREYPQGPLRAAIAEAERYGLFDLDRVERMVLRRIAHDYFRLKGGDDTEGDE
jgi:Mu transposase-like protein